MKNSERYFGLDIIRALAILLVPTIHAFAYIPVVDNDLLSIKWCAYIALHYVALICVPLFMILSGALMRGKRLSVKYYLGLLKIIIPYVIISIFAIAYKTAVNDSFPGVLSSIKSILNFTAVDYAWYVEMYIGLYLMIPFFNLIIAQIDKKGNQILLASLILLTALPKFLWGFSSRLDVLPDWWSNIYPITYYFLGAYLGEYKPKIKKGVAAIGLALSIALPTALNYFHSARDGRYAWYVMNAYDCLSTLMIAAFVWLLFADIKGAPRPIRAVITEISVCSFEMYLFSYIADGVLYRYADNIAVYASKLHIPIFFVMPALIIISSYAAARLIRFVSVPLSNLLHNGFVKVICKANTK